MSATGDLDVRVPIGALFSVLGVLLTAYGALEPTAVKSAFTRGGQINMWWGLVMLVFGVFMLLIARPSKSPKVVR
jgi:hypothetical protein